MNILMTGPIFKTYFSASLRAFNAVSFVYVPSNSSDICKAFALNRRRSSREKNCNFDVKNKYIRITGNCVSFVHSSIEFLNLFGWDFPIADPFFDLMFEWEYAELTQMDEWKVDFSIPD